jgi:hypothetical protein
VLRDVLRRAVLRELDLVRMGEKKSEGEEGKEKKIPFFSFALFCTATTADALASLKKLFLAFKPIRELTQRVAKC